MFHIKRNLPAWERFARTTAGLLVVGAILGGYTTGIMTVVAIAAAATMVLTAFVGFCPACAMVGRRTLGS